MTDYIENDAFFKEFLSGPGGAGNQLKSGAVLSLTFSEQITKLTEGLELISSELHSQVREQHGALLSQAIHAGKLTTALDAVSKQMERLNVNAEKLKTQINAPFSMIESQTKVLERLHDASHLLRQTGRFLQLYRKLQLTKDPIDQAIIFYELETFIDDRELQSIEFIREEKSWIIANRQRLNNMTNNDLVNSLKNGNDGQAIKSLQIFSNLQTLTKCVNNLLETFNSEIKHSIKECFAGTADISSTRDKQARVMSGKKHSTKETGSDRNKVSTGVGNVVKGPGKSLSLNTSQNIRTKLWPALEWLFDEEIYSYCQQIIMLQKCLSHVTQQNGFVITQQQNDPELNVEQCFWQNLENLLRNSFSDCAPHISQNLQQNLPKLLGLIRNLQVKLGTKFIFNDIIFESLDAGYLEKCAINLKTPLTGMDYPTQESVDNLIRAAQSELSAALVDPRLCLLVAGAFNACNRDFWNKIEAYIKLGTDSQQVVDIPNSCQIQNTVLANTIFYHQQQVQRMIGNIGVNFKNSVAAEKIISDLATGQRLILAIIQQLFESINLAINIILLSVHREPGLNQDKAISGGGGGGGGPSLYMKELQDFLQRVWNLHIIPFTDTDTIRRCGNELVTRCIDLFIRNVAIVRPLSMTGRHKLRADCQYLETAIKPICSDLSTLGKPYRQLRALSSLIEMSPDELSTQSINNDGIISSFIILMLLFGYAGSDLVSPHLAAGWSNEKLISWLDGHTSERERLELIAGALQKYRTIVRKRNVAQYDTVYPNISNYLEKAYTSL